MRNNIYVRYMEHSVYVYLFLQYIILRVQLCNPSPIMKARIQNCIFTNIRSYSVYIGTAEHYMEDIYDFAATLFLFLFFSYTRLSLFITGKIKLLLLFIFIARY